MEESISEWGKVFVLHLPTQPLRRTLLLKVFTTARPFRASLSAHRQPDAEPAGKLARSLVRSTMSYSLRRASLVAAVETAALTLNYIHPRVIDPPVAEEPPRASHKPLVPALLLTAASTFTAWYVYQITGQKLDLQTQVRNYAESLQQEKLARTTLTSAHIKILTVEGNTTNGVSAKIFWNPDDHACWIYLDHLPATAPEQFFQLWFYSREEKFQRARRFAAENGAAELNVQLPPMRHGKLERIFVSVETAEKYPFPEGQILVKAALP